MNRRGFLKGVGAVASSGGIAGKAVSKATAPAAGVEGTVHHQILKAAGWKKKANFSSFEGYHSSSTAQYTHPAYPGHKVHVTPPRPAWHHPELGEIEADHDTYWDHEPPHGFPGTHDDNHLLNGDFDGENSDKHLLKHVKDFHAKYPEGTKEEKKPAKSKSKTSNWGRAGKIAKGKPTQAKPSISMKEAFLIDEAIKLTHKGESNGFHFYHFQADNKVKGHIWAEPEGKKLHIHNIATNHNKKQGKPNAIGHKNMRDIFRGLKKHHPEAEHVTGIRVSGARPDASQSRVMANLKKV